MPDITSDTLAASQMIEGDDTMWVPSRRITSIGITDLQDQITRLRLKVLPSTKPFLLPDSPAGTPDQVTNISATESPFRAQDGTMLSNVSVSFTVNPSDTFFDHAQIWFTGYNGNPNPQLMPGDTRVSPAAFLCDTTHETVTVTVVAIGSTGLASDFSFAPHTTVLLDGVTSAPAAPSISQPLIGTPTGYQFAFNYLGGLAADQVSGYKVYRNTSGTFGTATAIKFYPHNPINSGSQVVQDDGMNNGDLFWYWVSAVNTTGLESTATAVTGSGTVANGVVLPSQNFIRNGNFSAGTANWNLTNGVSASNFLTGVSGLPVGNTEFKSSAVATITLESADFIPIDANKTHLISCWAKIPAGTSVNYGGFAEYDSNKNVITHVSGGAAHGYALFSGLGVTSATPAAAGGWQYFSALVSGPPVATPTPYQFATNTAYVRAIFLINNAGTPAQVEIADVRISDVEAVSLQALLKATGVSLISNPDFSGTTTPQPIVGGNGSYGVYDNNTSGKVTHSIVSLTTAPNSTGHVLQISTASGLPIPGPGLGGFFVALTPDSGSVALGSYHKGDTILWRITANIPVGYTLQNANNAFGTQGTFNWITSQSGTGGFYQYLAKQVIGTTGSFSSIGFFYLDSTSAAPVTWQVAVCEAIDISLAQLSNDIHHITRQGVSTKLLTQGSIVPTQAFTITWSTTTTSIALSWSSASLFRADGSTFSVASGSLTYSSLSSSVGYFIYPYITYPGGVLQFANGNPPPTAASYTFAAQQGFDGRIGLTPLDITTPASGTGSGSGGDGGSCPDESELVDVQGKGLIPAGEVVAGDCLKGFSFHSNENVYRRVIMVLRKGCAAWRIVHGHKVSPCEPVYLNGQWIAAFRVPTSTLDTSTGIKLDITVEADDNDEHNYWLAGPTPLLIHNGNILPRS